MSFSKHSNHKLSMVVANSIPRHGTSHHQLPLSPFRLSPLVYNMMYDTISRKQKSASTLRVPRRIFQPPIPQKYRSSKRNFFRVYTMASPQSAYVTAVPDDYDVKQTSSPTDSQTSAQTVSSTDFESFTWPNLNCTSPSTTSSSSPQSVSSPRTNSHDPASKLHSSHSHSTSLSQKWHHIITSASCPQSLSANPTSLNEITQELSHRDKTDSTLGHSPSQQSHDKEQKRRLAWAMERILTRPEESAEVCVALRKSR